MEDGGGWEEAQQASQQAIAAVFHRWWAQCSSGVIWDDLEGRGQGEVEEGEVRERFLSELANWLGEFSSVFTDLAGFRLLQRI